MTESWVTVATFEVYAHAILAKSVLESAGIECWLANEHLGGTKGFLSHTYGGIQLRVRPKDEPAARVILEEGESRASETNSE